MRITQHKPPAQEKKEEASPKKEGENEEEEVDETLERWALPFIFDSPCLLFIYDLF